jgi:indole-3-acetate monooxygenase
VPLVEEQVFDRSLAEAEGAWQAASAGAEVELAHLWAAAVAGIPVDVDTRVRARLAATHAAQVGASIVRTCFDLAGAGAIGRQHPVARCHRDGTVRTNESHHGPGVDPANPR